jgi:hypothetical protein
VQRLRRLILGFWDLLRVSAYYYICVLYMCPHTTIYVSYICVRILLYMCPIYVSAYYYIASVLGGSRRAAVVATHLGI